MNDESNYPVRRISIDFFTSRTHFDKIKELVDFFKPVFNDDFTNVFKKNAFIDRPSFLLKCFLLTLLKRGFFW